MTLPVVGPNIHAMSDRKWKGRDVTRLRESLGMTQAQFAKLLKVTQTAVCCWENETRPVVPYMAELMRLAAAEHREQQKQNAVA